MTGVITSPYFPLLAMGVFGLAVFIHHEWDRRIRPMLIPRAEEVAYGEEDHACRYCDTYQQGKWHRVRRELWRRHASGVWA